MQLRLDNPRSFEEWLSQFGVTLPVETFVYHEVQKSLDVSHDLFNAYPDIQKAVVISQTIHDKCDVDGKEVFLSPYYIGKLASRL